MKAPLFTAVIALAAAEALAADTLTRDEIAKLPFMAALAYAEAVDAYCLPEWHYASPLAAAAITQADLQNTSYLGSEQTREASRLKADRSACEPAKAFVNRVTATISEMQPKMDATLAALKEGGSPARRGSSKGRADRAMRPCRCRGEGISGGALVTGECQLRRRIAPLRRRPRRDARGRGPAGRGENAAAADQRRQSTKDGAAPEQGEVDPKRVIADWCARQTERTALCDEAK